MSLLVVYGYATLIKLYYSKPFTTKLLICSLFLWTLPLFLYRPCPPDCIELLLDLDVLEELLSVLGGKGINRGGGGGSLVDRAHDVQRDLFGEFGFLIFFGLPV